MATLDGVCCVRNISCALILVIGESLIAPVMQTGAHSRVAGPGGVPAGLDPDPYPNSSLEKKPYPNPIMKKNWIRSFSNY